MVFKRKFFSVVWLTLVLLASMIVCHFISDYLAFRLNELSGFNVFYQSGYRFLHDVPLYEHNHATQRPFIYPPSSALFFAPLSQLRIHQATYLFNWINFVATALLIFLTYKIAFMRNREVADEDKILLVFALLLCTRFVYTNFAQFQINIIVLCLFIVAYYFFVRGNHRLAGIGAGFASLIKVGPVIILANRFSRKVLPLYFYFALTLFGVSFITILFRGDHGFLDYIDYFDVLFVDEIPSLKYCAINHSPSALAVHLIRGLEDGKEFLKSGFVEFAISSFVRLAVLIPYLFVMIRRSRKEARIDIIDVALTLLLWHLISPITWDAHLVSLFITSIVILLWLRRTKNLKVRILLGFNIVYMLLIALPLENIFGTSIHIRLMNNGLITFYLIFTYVLILTLSFSNESRKADQSVN